MTREEMLASPLFAREIEWRADRQLMLYRSRRDLNVGREVDKLATELVAQRVEQLIALMAPELRAQFEQKQAVGA